jgi:hypothetical protein
MQTPGDSTETRKHKRHEGQIQVAVGIFSLGFLVFTLMLKVAVPITLGEFRLPPKTGGAG